MGRLLDADPGLANARDAEGQTPLLAAVDANRAGLVPVLLSRGADPGGVYAHSAHTPLSWAVTVGVASTRRGRSCRPAWSPISSAPPAWATSSGSAPSSAPTGARSPAPRRPGARASLRTAPGCRARPAPPREIVADALYIACRGGHEGAVRELLAHGPDLAFRAFAGGTALHWAYFAGAPRGGGAAARSAGRIPRFAIPC